jgi:short-subunit dehydrogenase
MSTALITGASGGIGYELALEHVRRGGDVILVARREDKLREYQSAWESTYGVKVHVIGMDLARRGSAQALYDAVATKGLTVDILINNAGFGQYGLFEESDVERGLEMLELNVVTLTALTRLFVVDMLRRRSGRIMNVASTASFQPVPLFAQYSATKAYVLSFSEALNNEVSDRGVTVTTLCPGPTTSGFQDVAAMHQARMADARLMATSAEVARFGYNAMLRGKTVAVHGLLNRITIMLLRFSPRSIVVRVGRMVAEKR